MGGVEVAYCVYNVSVPYLLIFLDAPRCCVLWGDKYFQITFKQVAGGIKTELCNSNHVGDLDTAELSHTIINFFLKCGPLTYF